MNGKRYLLDTNAVIALLQGNETILQQLKNANWVGISVISQLEFSVFPNLTDTDKLYFDRFLQRVEIVGLTPENTALMNIIIGMRQKFRVKLPDAIIVGTAIERNATLVTADKQLCKLENTPAWDFSSSVDS